MECSLDFNAVMNIGRSSPTPIRSYHTLAICESQITASLELYFAKLNFLHGSYWNFEMLFLLCFIWSLC